MSSNSRFYAAAEEELMRRRSANMALLMKRENEISEKFPEYRRLHDTIASTGNKLASLIIKGGNVKQKLAELERENLGAQDSIEQLLVKNGYPRNYLKMIYTCERCKDSGIYDDRRCTCFTDVVKRLAAEELNRTSPMKLCSFETFDLSFYPDETLPGTNYNIRRMMSKNLELCKDYAENFHLPNESLLMRGSTGLGKTHLSLAIANKVIEQGYSVVYGSAPDLFLKLQNEYFNTNTNETITLLRSTDLFILDDLGAEFDSQFHASSLYNIVNSRLSANLPMIVNTNLNVNELQQRYGDRITSRLLTVHSVMFYGKDIRQEKRLRSML